MLLQCLVYGQTPFITTWETTTANESITIPTNSLETYNYNVNWGDGTITTNETGNATHNYAMPGIHTITISGTFPQIYFFNSGDKDKILTIEQWGDNPWISFLGAFWGCTKLNITNPAAGNPNLTNVTSMSSAFRGATLFNGDVSGWNVSNITNMSSMFSANDVFNQDLSSWDVSKVTQMGFMFSNTKAFNGNISSWNVEQVLSFESMFNGAEVFNQDLENWNPKSATNMVRMFKEAEAFNGKLTNWDVGNVASMEEMFQRAVVFNQDISKWNVNNVTNMRSMFGAALVFNQDISAWQVGKVNTMRTMFSSARAFNQDIGGWDVSKVTDMYGMFSDARAFNQNIGRWNTGKVEKMETMFARAFAFNGDIGGWNVSKVTSMWAMFSSATAFNQDIGSWNTGEVTKMNEMFSSARAFNQDIGNWDTSKVTRMHRMFQSAASFDQDISNWNIGQVTTLDGMFNNAKLSTANYDALLKGWNTQTVQPSLNFDGGNSTYCTAATERSNLETANTWNIKDGGLSCPPLTCSAQPDANNIKLRPNITWNAITGANSYRITIGNTPKGNEFEDVVLGNVTAYQLTKELATSTKYYVTIYGRDAANIDIACISIEVTTRPELTCTTQVVSGRILTRPPINWVLTPGVVSYDLTIGTTPKGTDFLDVSLGNVDMYTPTNDLLHDTKYYVTIYGLSAVGERIGCHSIEFTTVPLPPACPTIDVPVAGATSVALQPSIEWTKVVGATNYRITVGSTSGGSDIVNSNLGDVDSITFTSDLLNNTQYYVTIYASNAGGESVGCSSISFTTIPASKPFITTWQTTAANETITIPTAAGETYNYTVDWGDGTTPTVETGDATHTYGTAGVHTVSISGVFPRIYFNNSGDKDKILTIEQWGDIEWNSMREAFEGCSQLNITNPLIDTPDLSKVTDCSFMFNFATVFNGDISSWNTSNVTDMRQMFRAANSFNQNIGSWNVGNVENMGEMFSFATVFNQDISAWDTKKVTQMYQMFDSAKAFNQDIGGWNVSNVNSMYSMFRSAENFNQNLNLWDVGQVNNMVSMFENAVKFNGEISNWITSKVTNMSKMFKRALAFNQDLNNWNVSSVVNMSEMFNVAKLFDREISNWDVSKVTDMKLMFQVAENFNQDISAWNVSNVTNMSSMFSSASSFNKNIGAWNVSKVTNMRFMFSKASSFNQDIGRWDVSNVTSMDHMFQNTVAFNQNIGTWKTGKVTQMQRMFEGAAIFNQNIGGWDVSNVTNMGAMFSNATAFNGNISSWNVGKVNSFSWMFNEASAFNQNISSWNLASATELDFMFKDASSFNQDIGGWTLGNATSLSRMFQNAVAFDQDISNWDVSNITSMWLMFQGAKLSTVNYDALLKGWNAQVLQSNVAFSGGNSTYCTAATERQNMIDNDLWAITDGGSDCSTIAKPFITTWETTTTNEAITIPTAARETYNYTVDWGDGTIPTVETGDATHTYGTAGVHTVSISGVFPRIYFNNRGDKDKILTIEQWGDIEWSSMESAFEGSSNLNIINTSIDNPDLSKVTDMSAMFSRASSFNGDISGWNTSNVTNMSGMFFNAHTFNIDISSWDTSKVISMRSMFRGAREFNHSIEKWNVSSVKNMSYMFFEAGKFDQDINFNASTGIGWNTSSVENMQGMFQKATVFNGNISGWDTSSVTDMGDMFNGANNFNRDISGWDVSKVEKMASMFREAFTFNQDIGFDTTTGKGWNTGNVTNMQGMFYRASKFNGDISGWDTSKVKLMLWMFVGASKFNQDIGGWNVSNVTQMSSMFSNASEFNQDIGGWDVSNVTNMESMFNGTTNFDQDLSSWNVSAVLRMQQMFARVKLSTANYDALLKGWNAQTLQPNVTFSGGNSTYCTAATERQNMIDNDFWAITDGGSDCSSIAKPFITTWQTTAANETITIPTAAGETYNYRVDWGDGSTPTVETGDATHTYGTAGVHTVSISGTFPRIYFNNTGDKDKILTIEQWGDIEWSSMESAFYGCSNLNITNPSIDTPDLSNLTNCFQAFDNATSFNGDITNWNVSTVENMQDMFKGATIFNQNVSIWDTSNVTNMQSMFSGAIVFNQDISGWDVSNVTDMSDMFFGVKLSTANYDALLKGWNTQVLQRNVNFSGGNSTYCSAETERANMIASDMWVITDGGKEANTVITAIADVNQSNSFTLPTILGTDLSGGEKYYTQANGLGTSYNAGEVIDFSDFTSYPVTLYVFDSGICGSAEVNFELILTNTPTPKPITITADAKNKEYGSADPLLTYQITTGSLEAGDVLSGGLTRVAGEAVGDYAINSTLSHPNYTITYVSDDLTISAKPITITADAKNKEYGSADPLLTYQITAGSLEAGDVLSGRLTRVAGEAIGDYAINSTLSHPNYTITYVSDDLTISAKPITITADAKNKEYGSADPLLTYQITTGSLEAGDVLSGGLTRVVGEAIGDYAINSTLSHPNYTITYVSDDLTISAKPITITADAKNKEYGSADPLLTYQITAGSLEAGDVLSGGLTRVTGEAVGDYAINSTLSHPNYTITYVSDDLTISAKPITITADAKNKEYGSADPLLTYQITTGSLETGDVLSGGLTRVAGEVVGDYAINSTLSHPNYTITYVSDDLTISAKPITIKADAKNKEYGSADPLLTYQITSGSLETGDVLSGGLTRVAGEAIGDYAINSTLFHPNYTITYISDDLTILPRAITILADTKTKEYGFVDPILTYQIVAGSLLPSDFLSGGLSRVPGENAGNYAINSTLSHPNYAITYIPGDLIITPKEITVAADAKTKEYATLDPPLTYQIVFGSLESGDVLSGTLTRDAGENVGSYFINSSLSHPNYEIRYISADLEITPKSITVTADSEDKVYGTLDPILSYQITTGILEPGDVLSGSLVRDTGEDVGDYTINNGLSNSNYTITFITANFTITPRSITVTANTNGKGYGALDPELTYEITSGSLVSGDVLSGSLEREIGEEIGVYAIELGTLDDMNYEIDFVSADFIIRESGEKQLELPNAFTPNNDGNNDVFEIMDLEKLYPNFEMTIFDRNGMELYRYKHNGDVNAMPVWWDGTYKGESLPTGTYYFSLNYNNGSKQPKTTWVYLNR